MNPTLETALDTSAQRAQRTGARWRGLLNEQDQRFLVGAFHRAESLARHALCHALVQVSERYRPQLLTQLQDEDRHVDVFAHWDEQPAVAIPIPKKRQRTEPVWFALLLVNEVAGFCQFHMLQGLLGEGGKAEAVAEVARDESEHIVRLARWLAPFQGSRAFADIERIVARFRRDLDGRMKQFLPRDEFSPFRDELSGTINELLNASFTLEG